MKKVFYLTIFILSIFCIPSCKSCKKDKVAANVEATYNNLIVSFYSPGSGIDYETANQFDTFLNSYTPKISYDVIHWGMEGEIDYCIDLSSLSPEERTTFRKKAKEQVFKTDRVNITENEGCREVRAED